MALDAVNLTGNWFCFVRQEDATLKSGRKRCVLLAAMISEKRETHQRDLAIRIGMELGCYMSLMRF